MGQLAGYRFLNRTLSWDADFENQIRALTPEQIVTAMRKHIDPAKIIIIKAGDFARSAAVTFAYRAGVDRDGSIRHLSRT